MQWVKKKQRVHEVGRGKWWGDRVEWKGESIDLIKIYIYEILKQ